MDKTMQIPALPINPKVSGVGVVIKKDGTVSKPEPEQKPEQPKEQDNGRNA
jgi:hypothetical protein